MPSLPADNSAPNSITDAFRNYVPSTSTPNPSNNGYISWLIVRKFSEFLFVLIIISIITMSWWWYLNYLIFLKLDFYSSNQMYFAYETMRVIWFYLLLTVIIHLTINLKTMHVFNLQKKYCLQ